MDNTVAGAILALLRDHLKRSAEPNMKLAIANGAPIAALVYGLVLVDSTAGFYCGADAKSRAKSGDGVGERYNRFLKEYLSPAQSGCDYITLDFYRSMRCNMAHSLTPGRTSQKGGFCFVLMENERGRHGTKDATGDIVFDVPTFCNDALDAVERYLGDVERCLASSRESDIVNNFKAWWDQGYGIMVSA